MQDKEEKNPLHVRYKMHILPKSLIIIYSGFFLIETGLHGLPKGSPFDLVIKLSFYTVCAVMSAIGVLLLLLYFRRLYRNTPKLSILLVVIRDWFINLLEDKV